MRGVQLHDTALEVQHLEVAAISSSIGLHGVTTQMIVSPLRHLNIAKRRKCTVT
jgi:hypothetical protein